MSQEYVDGCRNSLKSDICWVLFANGTVVILPNPASKSRDSLAEAAIAFIQVNGPVAAGTEYGDFNVVPAGQDGAGSFVTSHSSNLLTFVPRSVENELGGEDAGPKSLMVGLYGRSMRHKDSQDCKVVHVEGAE